MTKHHLISTSAHMDSSERIMEYENCYKSIYDLKSSFKSINIIETISKNKLQYLENTGLEVFYSPLNNEHKNKGVNWLRHMTNFISNSEIKDSEIIIFITGRYTIVNTNIISLIEENMIKRNFEFIAKEDNDIYTSVISKGVHTFFIAFTKSKFLDFSSWYEKNGKQLECIEHDLKRYMKTNERCLILPKEITMGIKTKIYKLDHLNTII